VTATVVQLGLGGVALWAGVKVLTGFVLRMVVVLFALLLLVGALGGVIEGSIPAVDAPPTDAAEPARRAVPIPWTGTQPRWRSQARCPDAFAPETALVALTARVDLLNGLRPGDSPRRGVLAMVRGENAAGICADFVATQTNVNVESEVRGALGPGEQAVWQETGLPEGWRDMHAEQKAVHAAWMAGFRPIAVAASSPFCDADRDPGRVACDAWLESTGAAPVGDRGAVWRW